LGFFKGFGLSLVFPGLPSNFGGPEFFRLFGESPFTWLTLCYSLAIKPYSLGDNPPFFFPFLAIFPCETFLLGVFLALLARFTPVF